MEIGTEAAQFLSWEYLFPVCGIVSLECRETGVGWPLLTVETELNGDSKSTNKRGPSLIGWAVLPVQEILFCLGSLVSTVQNIFFHLALFQCLCPHSPSPRKLGRQPCRVAFLLVCVSGTNHRLPANMGRIYYLSPTLLLSLSLW